MDNFHKTVTWPAEARDPLAGRSAAFKAALDAVERAGRMKAKSPADSGGDSGPKPKGVGPVQGDERHRSSGEVAVSGRDGVSGFCS